MFSYTITDNDGDTSTTTLTITVSDGSPTAEPESNSVSEAALDTAIDVLDLAASTVTGSDPTSTAETVTRASSPAVRPARWMGSVMD